MKKKKSKKLPKYMFGSDVKDPQQGLMDIRRQRASNNPSYIENPTSAIADNNIQWSRAEQEANKNPWTQGLDIFGNLALQVGSSMMNQGISKGQGISENGFNWGQLLQQATNMVGSAGEASTANQGFAFGGNIPNVPVEIEGKEVGETPGGEIFEAKGPSHEQGGINIALPEGTEMYSKRIKVDGVTMADRKKGRAKKTLTLEKLLENNKGDKLTKNSLKRTKQVNSKEEQADLKIQQLIAELLKGKVDPNGPMVNTNDKKLQLGTGQGGIQEIPNYINKDFNYSFLKDIIKQEGLDNIYNFENEDDRKKFQINLGVNGDGIFRKNTLSALDKRYDLKPIEGNTVGITNEGVGSPVFAPINVADNTKDYNNEEKSKFKNPLANITAGDALGMFGNLYQGFAPYKNTLENRAGDTPNINMFKDYGKEGLKTLDKTKGYVAGIRDKNLQDVELARAGNVKRARNSARGVNTMRALDLASTQRANKQQGEIYKAFAQQMMNILGQEAGMKDKQDQVVMQGEQARDLADRQDRDNFFTQLGKDKAAIGESLSRTGKSVNDIKQRSVQEKFMNQLFDWVKGNVMTGDMSQKGDISSAGDTSKQIANFDYKKAGYDKKTWDAFDEGTKLLLINGLIPHKSK